MEQVLPFQASAPIAMALTTGHVEGIESLQPFFLPEQQGMTETRPPARQPHDEGFYRQLVEMSHEGIWVIDAESKTVFINTTMAEQLGCSVDEMYGRSIFEFMDEEWRHIAQGNVQRLCHGKAERLDFKFRCKNGSVLWTILSTRPLFDKN